MSTNEVILWPGNLPVQVPATAREPNDILPFAKQLTKRDQSQIVSAFESGHYEMVATFIWNRALMSLKAQLGKLGANFISEMLDRPDIDERTPIEQKLTDYEAVRLAQDLGVIGGTGAFRLRHALETVQYFGSLQSDEAEDAHLTADEAMGVIRACVENVLGYERIDAALDFKTFRDSLTATIFDADDESVQKLLLSPYFFHRASMRMLLASIKTSTGAQLENALANANIIIPLIWPKLLQPEKFQVGRAYSEMVSDGRSTAASGLKKVLLKVRGFDFVPEDLRSNSFNRAAHLILAAHEGMDNFYNEPSPTKALEQMGSTIPAAAFPICMSAVLSVRLGNFYGRSWGAQPHAEAILKRITRDRWITYISDCLATDDRILYKLLEEKPATRWSELVQDFDLTDLVPDLPRKDHRQLLEASDKPTSAQFRSVVSKFIKILGYKSK